MPIYACQTSTGLSKMSYRDISGRSAISSKGGNWSCKPVTSK